MKRLTLTALSLLFTVYAAAAGITGFWQTIDDETNKPKSITAVYEYNGKIYGRILLTYEEDGKTVRDTIYAQKRKADKVIGNPAYCGLDFIWDMSKAEDGKYKYGKILNPPKGKIYNAEIWLAQNGDLIVRGKIGPFGKNQTWHPFKAESFPAGFTVPDIKAFKPVIPQVK